MLDLLTSPLLAHVDQRVAFAGPGPTDAYPADGRPERPAPHRRVAPADHPRMAAAGQPHGGGAQGAPSLGGADHERAQPGPRPDAVEAAARVGGRRAGGRGDRELGRGARRGDRPRAPAGAALPRDLAGRPAGAARPGCDREHRGDGRAAARGEGPRDGVARLATGDRRSARTRACRSSATARSGNGSRARSTGLGLRASVVLHGYADPAPHLQGARMFLSTSRAEGFSRALLEAMAGGLPAVSTAVGGATEIAGEGLRLAPGRRRRRPRAARPRVARATRPARRARATPRGAPPRGSRSSAVTPPTRRCTRS